MVHLSRTAFSLLSSPMNLAGSFVEQKDRNAGEGMLVTSLKV